MISFCIPTARPTFNSYYNYPSDVHLFKPFVDSLYPQLTEPIELVIADMLFDHRDLREFFEPYPLIKLIIINQKNWWIDNGYPSFSNTWNECVKHSTGDYLVILSDGVSFPGNFMSLLYQKRQEQIIAQILYYSMDGNSLIKENIYQDSRMSLPWDKQDKCKGFNNIPWSSCFGFFTIPREWFYKLNGYDENFDGQKDINDIEFFSRLHTYDINSPIEFDKKFFVYHHQHCGVYYKDNRLFNFKFPIRSNYDLIFLHRRLGISKANSQILKEQDLIDVVNGNICKVPERMKDAKLRWENGESIINYWIKNQPIFNL
jgi:hypothetical protein